MRIPEFISRLLLLVVYASFFVVQSFYTPGNNYSSAAPKFSIHKNTADHHSYKTFTDKKSDPKQSAVRLNKRFHPQAVLSVSHIDLSPEIIYIALRHHNKPKDYLLISSILTDSLRGPPAIG